MISSHSQERSCKDLSLPILRSFQKSYMYVTFTFLFENSLQKFKEVRFKKVQFQ